jgi:hypothetical protein
MARTPPGANKGPEMTDYRPRLFADDAAIIHVGEGLLSRSLPKEEWTHEAHLAASLWIARDCPNIDPVRDMATIISRYNVSVGGINDDTQGYHDTITRVYVEAVKVHLAQRDSAETFVDSVNALLISPLGRRDLPLRFYSAELLFSVPARRKFIDPDLLPLSAMAEIG